MVSVQAVTDPATIASAVRDIRRCLQNADSKRYVNHSIGTPGGGWRQTLYWIPTLGIWGGAKVNSDGAFHDLIYGEADPGDATIVVPSAKTSLALNGGKSAGGLLVRDQDGRLLLAHSGRVGGGKVGVNKTEFRRKYRGPKCLVQLEDKNVWYAVVGRLDDERFLQQVADFVRCVGRFKEGKGYSWRFSDDDFESFTPETGGESRRRAATSVRTHQDIVNALQSELTARASGDVKVSNDRLRDLVCLSTQDFGDGHTFLRPQAVFDIVWS